MIYVYIYFIAIAYMLIGMLIAHFKTRKLKQDRIFFSPMQGVASLFLWPLLIFTKF